jgi:amino acid adenylation domain-containing protein
MSKGAVEERSAAKAGDAAMRADGLQSGFLDSAERFPGRPAIAIGGREYSYTETRGHAAAIAATLSAHTPAGGSPLTAVFAYRTVTAFTGLLGTLLRGHGYVPLNRTLPPARTRLMLERSRARAVIVDRESAEQLEEILDQSLPMLVLAPDDPDVSWLRDRLPAHTVLGARELEPAATWTPQPVDPDALAYLLFTSGSTGVPKGVMVAHRNVTGLMANMVDRYEVTERDRVSQTHELTFDVSVFDMFVTWRAGACLCCPTQKELMAPGGFIRESGITIWFSVPSTAIFMKRLGMLKPDSYPALRHSLFAGEPMPNEVAKGWLEAAPGTNVENLYGPTEVTIVCIGYRWDPERSEAESEAGVIPIGEPLPSMRALVVDSELREVDAGETGELLVAGPQVTPGYWEDPERTAEVFIVPPGQSERFYRTGDRVRRPVNGRPMTYLGRLDHQIKVRGVRIELGEVEAAVREATGVDAVVAVGWPVSTTGADGIVAFIGDAGVDVSAAKAALSDRLPGAMVPRRFELLDELPLNASGKFDRKRLLESLEEEEE